MENKTTEKTPDIKDSEKFVAAVLTNDNVKAHEYLDAILKRKCAKKFNKTLFNK